MKVITLIFTLFSSILFGQTPKNIKEVQSASDKVIYMITEMEKTHTNSDFSIDIKWANEIACLSKIIPKAWNGTSAGVIYSPTLEEIQLWKAWFEKFKDNFKFGKDSSEILVEYKKGEFRTNKCEYY